MRVKLSVVSFDAKFGLRVVSKACPKSWMIEALVNFSPLIFFHHGYVTSIIRFWGIIHP